MSTTAALVTVSSALFPSGGGLLIWSIIYGLEHFDGWDGSELSCIAVANIVIGNTFHLVCRVLDMKFAGGCKQIRCAALCKMDVKFMTDD